MRNKNRPLFYENKKKTWPYVVFILITIVILIIWGAQVPVIRQTLGRSVLDGISYGKSLILPVSTVNPLNYRIQTYYPTLDLPSKEVIFAENLEDINSSEPYLEITFTPTPTPGVLWVIEDPEKSSTNDSATLSEEVNDRLEMPIFEMADYLNDGPASLSTFLRFYEKPESQYLVSEKIKPDYFDPNVSLNEMLSYSEQKYPDLSGIIRKNGNIQILASLIDSHFPVLIRLQYQRQQSAWKGDDLWDARYVVISGIDSKNKIVYFSDPLKGNEQTLSFDRLMEDWYPFRREYLVIYPVDREESLALLLNSDWDEEENSKRALEKFQTDVTMVPDNQFAWFNAAALLIENNHNEEAWDSFRTALQVGIPQRYLLYDFSLYDAAFKNGLAEELRDRTAAMLKINNHSEENWLWNGWAYTLLQDKNQAEKCFRKVLDINPNNSDGQYAMEYLKQYE